MNKKKIIVVVCRGNIARSAFAEVVINKELSNRDLSDKYISISRGIQGTILDPVPVQFPNITFYAELYRDTKPVLDKFQVDLSSHTSTPIDQETASKADILLAVDNKTLNALHLLFPSDTKKVHLLSELIGKNQEIIDPEGVSGAEKQDKIFTKIRDIILRGFPRLLSLL